MLLPKQIIRYTDAYRAYVSGKVRGRNGQEMRQLTHNLRTAESDIVGLCIPSDIRQQWEIRRIEALTSAASGQGDQKAAHYECQQYDLLLHLTRGE